MKKLIEKIKHADLLTILLATAARVKAARVRKAKAKEESLRLALVAVSEAYSKAQTARIRAEKQSIDAGRLVGE